MYWRVMMTGILKREAYWANRSFASTVSRNHVVFSSFGRRPASGDALFSGSQGQVCQTIHPFDER
jgi:hypothetical protein